VLSTTNTSLVLDGGGIYGWQRRPNRSRDSRGSFNRATVMGLGRFYQDVIVGLVSLVSRGRMGSFMRRVRGVTVGLFRMITLP